MIPKSELLELVREMDDLEAERALKVIRDARFEAQLSCAEEVVPDALDRRLLDELTGEDYRTRFSFSDVKRELEID